MTYSAPKSYSSDCFILQTDNNNLWYFFYAPDTGICYSLYNNKHWSNPITIIHDVDSSFSVSLTQDNNIYVFCQDLSGNVILCLYQKDIWNSKIILENKSNEIHNIHFQMLFDNQSLNLIYSMPIVGEKNSQLIYHSKDDNNKWNSPQILDTIIPFKRSPFIFQRISNTHSIAFYEKKGADCALGYREFSVPLKKWSNFKSFHSTTYTYIDQAFLTTESTIHTLYIVKTSFSYQLIYKYKNGDDWSQSVILYESNRMEICSLFILDNQLWVIWYTNSQLYTCISTNLGKTFSQPSRYKGHYIINPVKACFISNIKQKEEKLYIREILLNNQPIPELLLIPELYPEFYELNSDTPTEMISTQSAKPVMTDNFLEESINILKNRNLLYEQQLVEKDSQISMLIKEKTLLNKTKEILENQISKQGIEILSLQKQLESPQTQVKDVQIDTDIVQASNIDTVNKNIIEAI